MQEWVKKSDVLELLSLPSDIVTDHIYELKGIWMDEDWSDEINEYQLDGRRYVKVTGKCPMCEDCPDNCPLEG